MVLDLLVRLMGVSFLFIGNEFLTRATSIRVNPNLSDPFRFRKKLQISGVRIDTVLGFDGWICEKVGVWNCNPSTSHTLIGEREIGSVWRSDDFYDNFGDSPSQESRSITTSGAPNLIRKQLNPISELSAFFSYLGKEVLIFIQTKWVERENCWRGS